MKPFLSRSALSVSMVVILLALAVIPAFALENAYRWSATANRGAYSAIVTGNPTLRDDPNGHTCGFLCSELSVATFIMLKLAG